MSDAAAPGLVQWEYLELTRKTESFLLNDLNQMGAEGWELVAVLHHRELKLGESLVWTAIMKRPKGLRPAAAPSAEAAAAAPAESEELEMIDIFDVEDGPQGSGGTP